MLVPVRCSQTDKPVFFLKPKLSKDVDPVDGRNHAPPGIYIFLINHGLQYLTVSTGDFIRISEPSTVIILVEKKPCGCFPK